MATATYALLVDWDNDGTFTSAGEDVTTRTLHVEFSRGRDVDSQLTGRSVAGSLQAVLNNEGGDYNSYNATGTLYGSLLPGRLVRLLGSGTQTMWQGYMDRIVPLPSVKGLDTARLEAIGPLGFLNQKEVSLNTYSNVDTGSAVDLILTEAGWPTGTVRRDVDAGKTTMVRFWTDRKHTIEALREVEETEAGFVRESAAGKIVFENRHRRLTSPYTTSQATFTDASGATLTLQEMVQEDSLPYVFTEFVSTVEPYTLGSTGTLWLLNQTGTLSPSIAPNGGTRVFTARYPGPTASADHIGVDSWITPMATADWNVTTDQQGTGTNLNGSCTIAATSYQNELRIILTNNAAQPGYVTLLQARGVPLRRLDKVLVGAESTGTAYGKRSFPSKAKFMPNADEGQYWADWNLSVYQTATIRLTVTFVANQSTLALNHAAARDVSDRVTIVATGTSSRLGINGDYFIEAVRHAIEGDRRHTVTWYLSEARQFSDAWVLDVSALGTTTRLGY